MIYQTHCSWESNARMINLWGKIISFTRNVTNLSRLIILVILVISPSQYNYRIQATFSTLYAIPPDMLNFNVFLYSSRSPLHIIQGGPRKFVHRFLLNDFWSRKGPTWFFTRPSQAFDLSSIKMSSSYLFKTGITK